MVTSPHSLAAPDARRRATSPSTSSTDDGMVQAVSGVDFAVGRGEVSGDRGRVGLGQVGDGHEHPRPAARRRRQVGGRDPVAAARTCSRRRRRAHAPGPRRRDRHDLPGPADRAEPGVHGRRPDRRDDPGPREGVNKAGPDAGHRDARPGRHPAAGQAGRPVPARVLGRHAPAGDDRHGARLRPEAAHRRRAHHRPRRHRAGPGARGADRADPDRARLGRSCSSPTTSAWSPAWPTGVDRSCTPGAWSRPATVDDVFDQTAHPYTAGLLGSLPRLDGDVDEPLVPDRRPAAVDAEPAAGLRVPPPLPVRARRGCTAVHPRVPMLRAGHAGLPPGRTGRRPATAPTDDRDGSRRMADVPTRVDGRVTSRRRSRRSDAAAHRSDGDDARSSRSSTWSRTSRSTRGVRHAVGTCTP